MRKKRRRHRRKNEFQHRRDSAIPERFRAGRAMRPPAPAAAWSPFRPVDAILHCRVDLPLLVERLVIAARRGLRIIGHRAIRPGLQLLHTLVSSAFASPLEVARLLRLDLAGDSSPRSARSVVARGARRTALARSSPRSFASARAWFSAGVGIGVASGASFRGSWRRLTGWLLPGVASRVTAAGFARCGAQPASRGDGLATPSRASRDA